MILMRKNLRHLKSEFNILKLKKNNFFYSHYYTSNDEMKIENYENKNVKIYVPKEPLILENGVCPILKNNSKHTKKMCIINKIFIPVNAFVGYKFIRNLVTFRPVKSIFYGFILLITINFSYDLNKRLFHIIESIELLECGKNIRMKLANKKTVELEIKKIRVIYKKELEFLVNQEDSIFNNYYPFVANCNIYFISKDSEIKNEALFKEIMKGNIISNEKKIYKEKALNI